jgi:hypothetical protein
MKIKEISLVEIEYIDCIDILHQFEVSQKVILHINVFARTVKEIDLLIPFFDMKVRSFVIKTQYLT